tara:strand:+ start:43 stop:570 length:528 start_codon:yes stop_codon:yes gene_type:complete
MIKNILGAEFKYEDDKMYRLHKQNKIWNCCNDMKPEKNGYIRIRIDNKKYLLHRLIYKYHNENWDITDRSKNNQIDHIDINETNNKIENLRVLTSSQNLRNKNKKENSNNKYRGVYKSSKNRWRARISIGGENKHLGVFKTELEAHLVYEKKCKELMNNMMEEYDEMDNYEPHDF